MKEHPDAGHVSFSVRIDGISSSQAIILPDGSTLPAAISPGLLVVASERNVIFRQGEPAGEGLQELAEDGNPCPLIQHLAARPGIRKAEFVIPNLSYKVSAKAGDRLHFAVMFVHSNDLFYSFGPAGLPLFDDEQRPISGDLTSYVDLWDAGTEANQAPGVGPDQAPRQAFPGAGTKTNEPVRLIREVKDGFCYPSTEKVIRVRVTPAEN